ncbi:MAG TPA: DUF488 domain-containing protein [Thiobacillaceae bacterium]|nr:DUF488 domain-containing protein [Thiobacillaceae bacterium]HNU63451.1 DUF488 domain-containing protein [Thiobacillaceae bacterium]
MTASFVTIGHSSRELDEFLGMLRVAGVAWLVDVRAFPHSRSHPVFNIEVLPETLARVRIGYRHMPALGGRRARQAGVDPHLNALWREPGFHNYADYALGECFAAALAELVALGRAQRVALMCAEAVWWRCHRRIITDYLLLNGQAVEHLLGPGHSVRASPTPGAQRTAQGKIVYPAADHGVLRVPDAIVVPPRRRGGAPAKS